jgi:hypothetical protein
MYAALKQCPPYREHDFSWLGAFLVGFEEEENED